jgi:SAM-dependent methyltransferase
MLAANESKVLETIQPGDRVLDVGGWACPFNRADWVIDKFPHSTRGFYGTIGLLSSQGGELERFTENTWIQRDICDREPWPFSDHYFDYSICSQTLEDVRDPLFVCSELVRVSKRGYVEMPSRLAESCRGWEHPEIAGLSHHRWFVEVEGDHVSFTMKYHMIHTDHALSFSPQYYEQRTDEASRNVFLFWEDRFEFSEQIIHGLDEIRAYLRSFVDLHEGEAPGTGVERNRTGAGPTPWSSLRTAVRRLQSRGR